MYNGTARQCRDRYMNYLAPEYVYSEWTNVEDNLLAEKYLEYGPKWSKIQKFFPNRTANALKNRYNCTICRKTQLHKIDKKNDNDDHDQKESIKIQTDSNKDIFTYNFQNFFFENFEFNENVLNSFFHLI